MRVAALILALALAAPTAAGAESDRAGAFDYYVLALSWSPSWCAAEGDARGAAQCARGEGRGFVLHGLWPQHERGWPDYCRTTERDPGRAQTRAMADIMGDAGLAWHQWKRHGRCSGLPAAEYFDLSRRAFESVTRPEILRRLERTVRIAPQAVEEAFLEANPGLSADGVTVTCRDGRIAEVRICLGKDLAPRSCGRDVRTDCSHPAEFAPIR